MKFYQFIKRESIVNAIREDETIFLGQFEERPMYEYKYAYSIDDLDLYKEYNVETGRWTGRRFDKDGNRR